MFNGRLRNSVFVIVVRAEVAAAAAAGRCRCTCFLFYVHFFMTASVLVSERKLTGINESI